MKHSHEELFPYSRFFGLFIPVAVVIAVIAFAFREIRIDAKIEQIATGERSHLKQLTGFVTSDVYATAHRLIALSKEPAVNSAINNPSPRTIQILQSTFLTMANRNPSYQQIRWIDGSGRERVRIMRHKTIPFVVASGQLQNKSNRGYFNNTRFLPNGDIYVSSLDFNREFGQLEIPLRPTIRVASPMRTSKGRRNGILIINVAMPYMQQALRIAKEGNPDTEYFVLNEEGVGLIPVAKKKQSDPDSTKLASFSEAFPDAWNKIVANRSGSAELINGLWIWDKITPQDGFTSILEGSTETGVERERLHSNDLSLTVVSHKPELVHSKSLQQENIPILAATLVLLTVYAWSLLFMLRSQMWEKQSAIKAAHANARAVNLERLKELEARFHLSVEASSVGMIVVDSEGLIVMSNTAAEEMLGYQKDELEGKSVDKLLPVSMQIDHARLRGEFFRNPEVRQMGRGRELEAVTSDGQKIPVEVGLNPYVDHGKHLVLANIIDLSN